MTIMGASVEDEDPKEESMENAEDTHRAPSIYREERFFLVFSNILIVTIMISDFLYFTNIMKIENLKVLTISNLLVLLIAYISFLIKQRIRRRIERYEKKRISE
jgi:hypothetical protein